jgi:hypothetical protein
VTTVARRNPDDRYVVVAGEVRAGDDAPRRASKEEARLLEVLVGQFEDAPEPARKLRRARQRHPPLTRQSIVSCSGTGRPTFVEGSYVCELKI